MVTRSAGGPRLGQVGAAVRALLALTVLLGLAYPLAVTAVAQLAFPGRADGSLVERGGETVGSELVGQSFADARGRPRRGWFQGRPSAAGDGYDALASGASNLSPDNPALVKAVRERRATVARANDVAPRQVPADALLASGSGLDPDISPAYARLQVDRVARQRGLSPARVRELVARHTSGRVLGFLGEPTVDVLGLNLALARAAAADG